MSLIRQVRPRHVQLPYADRAGHLQYVQLTVWQVWADGRLIAETADPQAIPSILRHPSAQDVELPHWLSLYIACAKTRPDRAPLLKAQAGELPPSSRPVGEVEPPAEHDSQPAAPSHPPHDSPLGAMVLVLLAMCLIYAGIAWWLL
jgi:hypothetical protein